jgi:hypothetical protein
MSKQLFISHTHRIGEDGVDAHACARILRTSLRSKGWTVWFDEDDLINNIDNSMVRGIDGADVVIVLLTKEYVEKVNLSAGRNASNDNCLKEFQYAVHREKFVLPVVLQPCMKDPSTWDPGIVRMHLATKLCIDGTSKEYTAIATDVHTQLIRNGMLCGGSRHSRQMDDDDDAKDEKRKNLPSREGRRRSWNERLQAVKTSLVL